MRHSTPKGLALGKVPPATLLRAVYPYLGRNNRELLVGPGIGRDFAAVKYGNRTLVLSTDPITGTVRDIGGHSVYVNANDVATAGARPKWYLCTILLPPATREEELERIMAGLDKAARTLGITLVGGHTETTQGLTRPIIAGFMIGETKGTLLGSGGAREGDVVLLTKTAGLEGTAIIASEQRRRLKGLPTIVLRKARLFAKHLSVLEEALAAAGLKGVHALHDPTEGGVLNGLWELAEASDLGIEVRAESIPVAPETRQVCIALGLDPLKLMSSGSLLIAVQPSKAKLVSKKLEKLRINVSMVGKLTTKRSGSYIIRDEKRAKLEAVPGDELYKLA